MIALAFVLLFGIGGPAPLPVGAPVPAGPYATLAPAVTIDAPAQVDPLSASQITVTITAATPMPAGLVMLDAPAGMKLTPERFEVPAGNVVFRRVVNLVCERSITTGEKTIGASLTPLQANAFPAATNVAKFRALHSIAVPVYLWLALFGVVVGYLLRLFLNILKTIPPPAPAPLPPGAPQPGKLTAFVRKHYYFVDCGVTVLLGLLILAGLVTDGRPPAPAATTWGAFGVGAALGLLTNSELMTRLR